MLFNAACCRHLNHFRQNRTVRGNRVSHKPLYVYMKQALYVYMKTVGSNLPLQRKRAGLIMEVYAWLCIYARVGNVLYSACVDVLAQKKRPESVAWAAQRTDSEDSRTRMMGVNGEITRRWLTTPSH